MACQRGFYGDLSGFLVSRFSDENHIRILPEEGAKDAGKIESNIFVCLHLAKAGEILFDGIFGCRDVDFRRIDFIQ